MRKTWVFWLWNSSKFPLKKKKENKNKLKIMKKNNFTSCGEDLGNWVLSVCSLRILLQQLNWNLDLCHQKTDWKAPLCSSFPSIPHRFQFLEKTSLLQLYSHGTPKSVSPERQVTKPYNNKTPFCRRRTTLPENPHKVPKKNKNKSKNKNSCFEVTKHSLFLFF